MQRENGTKIFVTWLEETWEEIEVQFYGIIGAMIFFILVYLFFKPNWMKSFVDFLINLKISFQ